MKKNKSILNIQNLNISFKNKGMIFHALKDVTFTVDKGDFFGVIGESGSGKSTIGKCINKLYQPTAGKIEIDDHLVSNKRLNFKTKKWLRKNVQMIFQDPLTSLNPTKNVIQLISEPLKINKNIYFEVFNNWKKMNDLAFCFLIDYKKYTNKINYDFKLNYFKTLNEKLKNLLDDFKNIINFDVDAKINREKLLYLMDTFVEINHENSSFINEYLYENKKFLNELKQKEANEEYSSILKKYKEIEIQLLNAKKYLNFSKKGVEVLENLKIKKNQLKNFKQNFKNDYLLKSFSYLKSYRNTFLNNIKNVKEKIYYSFDSNNFNINYSELSIANFLLFFSNKIAKNKYLSKEEIDENFNKISNLINNLYEPINKRNIDLFLSFDTETLENKKIIIQELSICRLFSKLIFENYKKNKFLNYFFVKKNYDFIESKYNNYFPKNNEKTSNKIWKSFEDFYDFTNSIYKELNNINQELNVKNNNRIANFNNDLSTYNKEILDLKKALAKIKKEYKRSSFEYNENKLNFQILRKEFLKYKKEKQIDFKNNLNDFNKNNVLEENNDISEIRKLKKEKKENLKKFYNLCSTNIYLIKKELQKNSINVESKKRFINFFKTNSYINSLKKEVKLRIRSASLIDFEYKNVLKENFVINFIFSKSRFLNWIMIPFLFSIFKKQKVYDALDKVGLKKEHAYRYPHEFSGGQRQRIVIARALISDPKIIIADEPISALDVSIQAQIINILRDLCFKNNVTVIFIAHDLSMVKHTCENVIIMHRGRILEKGKVEKIFENPIHPYTKSLLKSTPKLSTIHVDLASFNENLTYEKEWTFINKPSFIDINKDETHYVFGTKQQIEKWILEK